MKLKEVHVINVSPLIDTIINWVKPFLKEKIRNRIHVHAELESLYKFVPKDILPTEYGGNAGSIQDLHSKFRLYIRENMNSCFLLSNCYSYDINSKHRFFM